MLAKIELGLVTFGMYLETLLTAKKAVNGDRGGILFWFVIFGDL
jgi:hypothetical protein